MQSPKRSSTRSFSLRRRWIFWAGKNPVDHVIRCAAITERNDGQSPSAMAQAAGSHPFGHQPLEAVAIVIVLQ